MNIKQDIIGKVTAEFCRLLDMRIYFLFTIELGVIISPQIMEVCTRENEEDCNRHRNERPPLLPDFYLCEEQDGSTARRKCLLVFDGCFCTLGEGGFQGFVAIGGFTAFAFAGTFVVARSHTDPTGKSVLVSEIAHVCACFGKDLFRTDKADTGNLVQLFYGALLLLVEGILDHLIRDLDQLGTFPNDVHNVSKEFALGWCDVAFNCCKKSSDVDFNLPYIRERTSSTVKFSFLMINSNN